MSTLIDRIETALIGGVRGHSAARITRRKRAAASGFAIATATAAAAALVVLPSDTPPSPATNGEAVAATPTDAARVVDELSRGGVTPIPRDDTLVRLADQEIRTDGVDPTRGFRIALADGRSGWLLGGHGTVCLLMPGHTSDQTTTNCQEAGDARQHGIAAITRSDDPGRPGDRTATIVLPPAAARPYITAAGSTTPKRQAEVSSDGTIATSTVAPNENLIDPNQPGDRQTLIKAESN
jgi:hypothetical protein